MKKSFTFLAAVLLFSFTTNAQNWVGFATNMPAEPQINVTVSTPQQMKFTVILSGFYSELKEGGYQRLSIPGCNATETVGYPELPILSKTVAIPECSNVNCQINVKSKQTLNNYKVYPAPDWQQEVGSDGSIYMKEIFTVNTSAYAQNITPISIKSLQMPETGYLRSQYYVNIPISPIEYNPATKTLYVNKEIEVTLTFTNPISPVNVNVGIFNNVATNALLNYQSTGIKASVNDKAFEKSGFQQGNVRRLRISSPVQVKGLTADYLIICSNALYNHPQVDVLANHRAWYNGFDVLILNVEDILSDQVGFSYEEAPNTIYKKPRRIRTCIRTIFETGTANHTLDNKLGYVLLVGDVDLYNSGMPSSQDNNFSYGNYYISPIGTPPHLHTADNAVSDYYFSCITKNSAGKYDDIGDVYIGRFCVENNLQSPALYKMVQKTIAYERELDATHWRKKVLMGFGPALGSLPYMQRWINYLRPILQNQHLDTVAACYFGDDSPEAEPWDALKAPFRDSIINKLNAGTGFFDMYSHGSAPNWFAISVHTLNDHLFNNGKTPFCMSESCYTGYLDPIALEYNAPSCLAEYSTSFAADRGFVGMLASSRICWTSSPDKGYHGLIPLAIYQNLSHIMGEFVLEAKLKANDKWHSYCYNLFGDPALNIMAEGFEVTRCVTLDETTNVSTNVTVKNGGCLIVPANGELYLDPHGSIVVESGGRIELGNNAHVIGMVEGDAKRSIKLTGGSVSGGVNSIMENILFKQSSSGLVENIQFVNSNFFQNTYSGNVMTKNCSFTTTPVYVTNHAICNFENCAFSEAEVVLSSNLSTIPAKTEFLNSTFTQAPLSHGSHKLVLDSCAFNDRSDVLSGFSIVDIKNSQFNHSGFRVSMPSGSIGVPQGVTPLSPYVDVSGCTFKNTGKIYLGENEAGNVVYATASIGLIKIPEFNISNNTIINVNASKTTDPGGHVSMSPFGEGIYLTGSGSGNANNRIISGNDVSECETGLYVYNSQVNFSDNKVHDNIYGGRLFNNSKTSFTGNSSLSQNQQIIRDNLSYEFYATNNCIPIPFRCNQIIDEDNRGNAFEDPLLYYDEGVIKTTDPNHPEMSPISIILNHWGANFVKADDIYPSNRFTVDPIWTPSFSPIISDAEQLYQTGINYFAAENYIAAEAAFKEIIEDYPESQFAVAALHELFALEQFVDNDYETLHNFYENVTDSALLEVSGFLATRCNVQLGNWQPAVDWYEDRIENPPSFQDSIFAVIDLGDIHLAMDSDSSQLKSGRIIHFSLPQIKPKSRGEYEKNKAELLALLPKIDKAENQRNPLESRSDSKGVLEQNIPNPANETTIISYHLFVDGEVEIRIYNQLGQLLETVLQHTKPAGSHQIEINLGGVPTGMYHYMLLVNGEKSDAKKMIIR